MNSRGKVLVGILVCGIVFAYPCAVALSKQPKPFKPGKCETGNCLSGFGKMVWPEGQEAGVCPGITYEGYFKGGVPNGYGKLFFPCTGVIDFGEFKGGKMHGIGTTRWPTGEGYTGEWKNGNTAGTGFRLEKDGSMRIQRGNEEPGLSLTAKGEIQREDIYDVHPTKTGPRPNEILIPKDLDSALKELKTMLTPELLQKMKKGTEEDMIEYHFGLGMWLRNNWGLWGGSPLAEWFKAQGVSHPDNMSGVILTSLWRDLNQKPLELQKQLKDASGD